MIDEDQLAESKSIHRRTGRTFYYATRLLPERVRHATYVLYGFFRVADEVVDDPGEATPKEQRKELAAIREAALGNESTHDPVLSAFSAVRARYDIPDEEVEVFIRAMQTDIDKSRYESYEELASYMRGSAAAVGVMMTYIMEADELETTLPHAKRLGKAFQLTNVVRDVGEDIEEHDRVYLPRETLEAYGAAVETVERGEFTPQCSAAVEHELDRAERLYREGVAGIKYLPWDCQLPVLTAAVLYAEHHRYIRERNYDTITETPSLGTFRKVALVAKTRLYWALSGDPEAVFAKVSAVSVPGESTTACRPDDPLATN